MIISRTPFRISFFGGGTDYPEWFEINNGYTISTTIDKYCYINLRNLPPFFSYKFRLRYFIKEEINKISQIKHPSIKHCLKYMGFENTKKGLEIVHHADLPALSGLGSSSTFTVGLLNTLYAYKNIFVTKKKLAMDAIHVERNLIGEKVGSQDQTAASFGGLNFSTYESNGNIKVENIPISSTSIKEIENHSMLFFTGLQRSANNIAQDKVENIKKNKINSNLYKIQEITNQAVQEIFMKKKIDFKIFGQALSETWNEKKKLSLKVSNTKIDEIYKIALSSGAYGGKLLGAGGGGFFIFMVPKQKQMKLKKELSKLLHVPFRIDNTGSQIIYYSSQK